MNSKEIFKMALGLSSPWYVEKVEFIDSAESVSKELHLYLNFERGCRFTTGSEITSTAYDTIKSEMPVNKISSCMNVTTTHSIRYSH